jgi:transposase, IS6 family
LCFGATAAGQICSGRFEAEIIVLCVRWYLRFGLSFRNLEEMMAERNLYVDHVTIWRWVQRYAPE